MNIQDLGVSEELSEALKKQQIEKAFPVQEQVIPKMLAGENVVAIAPTGTGKTLAYLLPALMRIDAADPNPQAVVLAPTYELAMQIARTAQELTQAPHSQQTSSSTTATSSTVMAPRGQAVSQAAQAMQASVSMFTAMRILQDSGVYSDSNLTLCRARAVLRRGDARQAARRSGAARRLTSRAGARR